MSIQKCIIAKINTNAHTNWEKTDVWESIWTDFEEISRNDNDKNYYYYQRFSITIVVSLQIIYRTKRPTKRPMIKAVIKYKIGGMLLKVSALAWLWWRLPLVGIDPAPDSVGVRHVSEIAAVRRKWRSDSYEQLQTMNWKINK